MYVYSTLPWQPLVEPHFPGLRKWLPWQCNS